MSSQHSLLTRALVRAAAATMVSSTVLLIAACDDDDTTDKATATPAGTGVAVVDQVLAGVTSGDAATIESLMQFTSMKCATNPQGMGVPPKCPAGVADGATVEAVLTGNCEGTWVVRDERQTVVDFIRDRSRAQTAVYAVAYAASPQASVNQGGLPPAKYTAIYGSAGEKDSWYLSIDSGIVSVFNGCAQLPEEIARRRDTSKPNDGFLVAPRD